MHTFLHSDSLKVMFTGARRLFLTSVVPAFLLSYSLLFLSTAPTLTLTLSAQHSGRSLALLAHHRHPLASHIPGAGDCIRGRYDLSCPRLIRSEGEEAELLLLTTVLFVSR